MKRLRAVMENFWTMRKPLLCRLVFDMGFLLGHFIHSQAEIDKIWPRIVLGSVRRRSAGQSPLADSPSKWPDLRDMVRRVRLRSLEVPDIRDTAPDLLEAQGSSDTVLRRSSVGVGTTLASLVLGKAAAAPYSSLLGLCFVLLPFPNCHTLRLKLKKYLNSHFHLYVRIIWIKMEILRVGNNWKHFFSVALTKPETDGNIYNIVSPCRLTPST